MRINSQYSILNGLVRQRFQWGNKILQRLEKNFTVLGDAAQRLTVHRKVILNSVQPFFLSSKFLKKLFDLNYRINNKKEVLKNTCQKLELSHT